MRVLDSVDALIEPEVPDDSAGILRLVKDLITLRKATEHQLSMCAAVMDKLGIAREAGSTTSKLLQANGAAPSAAARSIRVGTGLVNLDRTTGYFRDGFLSPEHVDAIAKGLHHIDGRSEVGVTTEERSGYESTLLSHAISGAPPAEVEKTARGLGSQIADDTGGPPPCRLVTRPSARSPCLATRCRAT